ncbi:hypothetical protein EVAR_77817_1 [Eumeta japonica]|uniref:Uncharacterized protein n=1 Tax=Eumeta variegata TaxID=151549 RepID=A0A4C1TEI0_EUMVA|nr:hypothetical protein EVAR_77817_1 [Eumeta japonica]
MLFCSYFATRKSIKIIASWKRWWCGRQWRVRLFCVRSIVASDVTVCHVAMRARRRTTALPKYRGGQGAGAPAPHRAVPPQCCERARRGWMVVCSVLVRRVSE